MQPDHGVQAVEQAPELDDVLALHGLVVEAHQQAPQPADLVLDLGVRAAHRGRRVGPTERSGHQGDEQPLVGLLVREQLTLEPVQQRAHRLEVALGHRHVVGHRPDLFDQRQHGVVFGAQRNRGRDICGWHRDRVDGPGKGSPQGDRDRQHVDDFLHDRTGRGWERPAGGGNHRDERQSHPDQDGLHGNPLRATRDEDRVGKDVEPVDGEHDVRSLGRRGRTTRGKRHTDPGRRERRSIVDTVADHDRCAARGLVLDRGEFGRRVAVGQHLVDADNPPDHVADVGAVARDEHDARDPGPAQRAHHPGCVGPDRVFEEEGSGRLVVDGGEDRQRTVQVGPPTHLTNPRRRVAADDPRCLAESDPVIADSALQAVAVHLSDILWKLQDQPAAGAPGDDGAREHMRRDLVERGGKP